MSDQDGKYGNLIRRARQADNQKTRRLEPENQASGWQDLRPDNQTSGLPANQVENKPVDQIHERRVNLCVKVPESWRKHWSIQAKIKDITMTEVMIEALTARFGLPDDQ